MALPLYTPTTTRTADDEVRRRTLDEFDGALRGAESRALPTEFAPLEQDGTDGAEELDAFDGLEEAGVLDDLSLSLPPGVLVEGGAVVLPLRRDGGGPAPDWKDRALCAETDPEAFFPEKGGSTREAKKVCVSCDVRAECLDFALGNDERFGIWGGLSERERRRLKKRVV